MFDELFKALKKLDGRTVSVELPADDEGFLDRCCPEADCRSRFKVLSTDWEQNAISVTTEMIVKSRFLAPPKRIDPWDQMKTKHE